MTVIDSNSQWDGIVRIREQYDPQAAAARYPTLRVHAYRFSAVQGFSAPAPAPTQTSQAATLTPGTSARVAGDRSEEHTSELQSLMSISYAVFCLKKKTI